MQDATDLKVCGVGNNVMYKNFFGLSEAPFNVSPDPRFLHLTPTAQAALDELTYGIHARKGLILLTGEAGTGKTTLIHRLLAWLQSQQTPTAYIFNSHLESKDLLELILSDFQVPKSDSHPDNNLLRLNQWLISRYQADDTPVLIVDEAQGLPTHVLEEIRMLLNLETPHQKLLQIVLAGQPELEGRLRQPDLRQLKQRIMLRCKTAALTKEENAEYVQARLRVAGAGTEPIFSTAAIDAIHRYSNGIPRIVNVLCEHALINGYADQLKPITEEIICEVAEEFQFKEAPQCEPLFVFEAETRGIANTVEAEHIPAQEKKIENVPLETQIAVETLQQVGPDVIIHAEESTTAQSALPFSEDDLQEIVEAVAQVSTPPERKPLHVIEMRPIGTAPQATAKHVERGAAAAGQSAPRATSTSPPRVDPFSLRSWSERCSGFVNDALIAPLYEEIARAFAPVSTAPRTTAVTFVNWIYWANEPMELEPIRHRVSQWLSAPWSPDHLLPESLRALDPKRRTLVAKRT